MEDFVKEMLKLGGELQKADDAFHCSMIINDAEILYNNHVKALKEKQALHVEGGKIELIKFMNFISKTPQAELEFYSNEELVYGYLKTLQWLS